MNQLRNVYTVWRSQRNIPVKEGKINNREWEIIPLVVNFCFNFTLCNRNMLLFHQILLEVLRLMSVRNYLDAGQIAFGFELAYSKCEYFFEVDSSCVCHICWIVCICMLYRSQELNSSSTDFTVCFYSCTVIPLSQVRVERSQTCLTPPHTLCARNL